MSQNGNTGTGKQGRRLRLSLRGLMVLLFVFAVALAWKVNGVRAQRRAVEAIERMGGHVKYDYEYYGGNEITGGKPRGTDRLRKWLGDEYFRDVTCVELTEVKPGADRLRMLGSFPQLETLIIVDCSPNDAEMARVGDLKQLRTLMYADIAASDSDLARLKRLTHLRGLGFGGGSEKLTDAGLINLRGLKELRELDLSFNKKITDTGLINLCGLKQLRVLDLSFNENITDRALETLGKIESLEWLDLEGTKATADGAAKLRKTRPSLTIILRRSL